MFIRTWERRRLEVGELRLRMIVELFEERREGSCCKPALTVAAAWRDTEALGEGEPVSPR